MCAVALTVQVPSRAGAAHRGSPKPSAQHPEPESLPAMTQLPERRTTAEIA
jgi:hypothetical protein